MYQHPEMDFDAVLKVINFREIPKKEIIDQIPDLIKKYNEIRTSRNESAGARWVMGNLIKTATGNIPLSELRKEITL